jgi:GTPase SAR1 family protein
VINLTLSSCTLHCWDLGGQSSLRSMWTRYLDDAEVLVWAMDANDWLSAAEVPTPTAQELENLPQEYQQDSGAQSEADSLRRRNESWAVLGV